MCRHIYIYICVYTYSYIEMDEQWVSTTSPDSYTLEVNLVFLYQKYVIHWIEYSTDIPIICPFNTFMNIPAMLSFPSISGYPKG